MNSVLEQRLLVVTGKGGVGKSTVAGALGLLAARRGLRAIVVEVGDQSRLCSLFGLPAPAPGAETRLEAGPGAGTGARAQHRPGSGARDAAQQAGLWSTTIDPDRALLEWLQALGGRVSGRVLASSGTFQYFAAAAPGAKELVSMVSIWQLTQRKRWRGRGRGYDIVVLDAPATGHALGMLSSPRTFGAIARVGPIATQAQRVQDLLQDPERCGYIAVAQGTDMAVTEALELQERLSGQLGRELDAVIVNGVLPQRFTGAELSRLESVTQPSVARSAAAAARAVHERARFQHNQIARLRRRRFAVLPVPFQFLEELDVPALERIANELERKLAPSTSSNAGRG